MKIATWNVNGIRARLQQFVDWMETEAPDVVCLQEIKAPTDKVPTSICDMQHYWCHWHASTSYSGVALLVRRSWRPEAPGFEHPAFDFEDRIVTTTVGNLTVASIYAPNGGKDFAAKMHFLESLEQFAAGARGRGHDLILCGDLNVARTDMDVHPKERKPNAIGQRPDERQLLEGIISHGLVDVGRAVDADNEGLFTWWAPWRNMRQRNIGWRLDYVLASDTVAARVKECRVGRETGTSDHGPVVAVFADS